LADSLANGANNGSLKMNDLANILSLSVTVNVVNTDGSLYTVSHNSTNNMTITIVIAVIVSVLSAILVSLTLYILFKNLQKKQRIGP